ncbi:unnamed protein product [Didymodactylos carnosus]|uniref:Uncharacterized protein n=1 Tax=Didymodactylos carnosus TaxID=1234261 RepID=A0A815J442_9BILA|nr:unnamed protein product [Didymodactylos carnosus]CAF1374291.1 unnamed protein product [Didymodactylos carnosus]CAF3743173.1 unnamed protein product [Didymodactylos carnosus]CAF4263429.1 unnamed protein product [Didymodactylos carnosus]
MPCSYLFTMIQNLNNFAQVKKIYPFCAQLTACNFVIHWSRRYPKIIEVYLTDDLQQNLMIFGLTFCINVGNQYKIDHPSLASFCYDDARNLSVALEHHMATLAQQQRNIFSQRNLQEGVQSTDIRYHFPYFKISFFLECIE